MRLLLLCVLGFLSGVAAINAQSAFCLAHPTEPAAQFVASFTVSVTLGTEVSGSTTTNCQSHNEICVWLMPSGNLDYVIDITNMTFTGNCGIVNTTPLSDILDIVSHAALEQGVIYGFPPCPDSTNSIDTIEVLTALCGDRSGNDSDTRFIPCDPTWCKRIYQVICTNGISTITELPGAKPECPGGVGTPCEGGCADTSGGLTLIMTAPLSIKSSYSSLSQTTAPYNGQEK